MARPRDYQKECIRALANARVEGKKKALVVMASGLGKTLTAIFDVKNYLEANPAARVLMLCHSADILRQTKEVFKTEFGDEYSYGLHNGQEKACRKTDFLFANLQSVDLHKEDFNPQDFDYIIVDEAHHSAAPTYGRSIEYFEPDFILGLTATPDRMDGQKLDQFFGDKPVYSKDLVEAIKEGLLSDIDYYVEIDEENRQRIREMIGEDTNITYADIDGLATNNYTANEDVVAKIHEQLAKMEDPTTVIFCQTIEHADAIHALIPNESAIVYSKYDSVTNNENIAKFRRGDIKTIITINMFNEGIDIPRTDVVVFLRVTQSKTIFLQQLGRGLRKAESKEKVVVMDFVGTGARIRQIIDFGGQFSTTDKKNKRPNAGNRKGGPGYGYFNLHLGGHESYESVGIELVNIVEKISLSRPFPLMYWQKRTNSELLKLLKDFYEEIGHEPTFKEVDKTPNLPSSDLYRNRFGTFRRAKLLAGIPSSLYDKEDLKNDLLKKTKELGRAPTKREVESDKNMAAPHTYTKIFGCSWNDVLKEVGLSPKSFKNIYTKKNVIKQIQLVYKKTNEGLPEDRWRAPSRRQFLADPDVTFSDCVIQRLFGSWNAALLAAGIPRGQCRIRKKSKC